MSKFDKLIQRVQKLDKGLRFKELQKVLEYYGYRMGIPSGGSSHVTFRKPGETPITIPKNEPIKKAYVEMVKEVVESGERDEEKEH